MIIIMMVAKYLKAFLLQIIQGAYKSCAIVAVVVVVVIIIIIIIELLSSPFHILFHNDICRFSEGRT